MVGNNSRQIVFVLGMHRSGTSALTGALTLLGAPMPATPMADQEENAKGFFESIPVMQVNDAMLEAGGAAWDDWGAVTLPEGRRAEFHEQLQSVLQREFGEANFVALKDPRICRLFPAWMEAAGDAGFGCHAIVPYRHPLEVAESLHVRNGLSIAEGILLWLRYVLDAEFASRSVPRAFVTMAELLEDWRSCLQGIATKLGIDWPVGIDAAAPEIDAFLDGGMRHQRHFANTLATHPLLIGWAASAYGGLEALRRADTVANRKALDRVREEFDRVSRLVAPAAKAALSRQRARLEAEIRDIQGRVVDVEALIRAAVEAQASALQQGRADLLEALDRAYRARGEADGHVQRLTEELAGQRRAWTEARKAAAKAEAQRAAETEGFVRTLAEIRGEHAAVHADMAARIEALQTNLNAAERNLADNARTLADKEQKLTDSELALADKEQKLADAVRQHAVERLAMQARIDALQSEVEKGEERLKHYREAGSGEFLTWALRRTERP